MSQVYTTETTIRKNRLEYRRLMAFVARLNLELFLMKQRMKKIATDEQKWLGIKLILSLELEQLKQRKADLEQQPISKSLSVKGKQKQLDKIEKQLVELNAQYTRNEHHLAVIEKRKYKDNPVKLVLKEAKRDEICVRAQAAYEVWKYVEQLQQEQLQQQEETDCKSFVAQQQEIIETKSNGNVRKVSYHPCHTDLIAKQVTGHFWMSGYGKAFATPFVATPFVATPFVATPFVATSGFDSSANQYVVYVELKKNMHLKHNTSIKHNTSAREELVSCVDEGSLCC